jgi:lipopolysaccharide exporter
MSLSTRAARGAIWTIASSMGARVVGLIGTLYMTRLLEAETIGQVSAAFVLVQTANWLTHCGFNQYLVVRGPDGISQTYHAAVLHLGFGLIGMAAIAATGGLFASPFNAPDLGLYVPGLALAVLIRRLGAVADKILVREMRFRPLALANGLGEVGFTISAVLLAALTDLGGHAIVIANILQSVVATTLILRAAGFGWLRRAPWSWDQVRAIFRFGLPLGVESVFHNASRYWDNLVMSAYFGPGVLAHYNMAYNLADIPAVQVGEQISSVLLPAMNGLSPEDRKHALVRSTALLALLIFPLAIGLGVIAHSLVDLVLSDEWQGVAPLLVVLSALSVFRPVTWVISSYMQTFERNRALMLLEILKVALLLGCIVAFSALGPVWAAASVGIAFGAHALVMVSLVVRLDSIPAARLASGFLRPLLACGVMAAAVLGTRWGLEAVGVTSPALLVPAELAAGALSYVPAAFVFAPATTRDFLQLLKRALKRG